MKRIMLFGLVLVSILVLGGCAQQQTNTVYVCPDGQEVSDVSLCSTSCVASSTGCKDNNGWHDYTEKDLAGYCKFNRDTVVYNKEYVCLNNLCEKREKVAEVCEHGYLCQNAIDIDGKSVEICLPPDFKQVVN